MSDFRIIQNVTRGLVAFTDRTVDTHLVEDAAQLAVTQTRGRSNPLHAVATAMSSGKLATGVFRPNLHAHTTSRVISGTGTGALDDAVQALHNLGRRHGVDGISVSQDPNLYGLLKLKGSIGYESGERVLAKLGDGDVDAGRRIAFRIDAAARRALDFVGPPL